jgi:NitT/TauT family transport system substrate-binding protein
MSKYRCVPAFAMAALLAGSLLLAGCANTSAPTSGMGSTPASVQPAVIRLGNLPTEDILPLWAAQQKGLFDQAGIKVEIVPFQSAQERDAAYTAGAIDGFMGDMIAVGTLNNGGFPTKVVTICLGATPAEGRFGVVASPKASISGITRNGVNLGPGREMGHLANVPVATSLNTIQEYVLDGLFAEAGVPTSSIKTVSVPKVPVRFELLMANKLQAAALPEPFLSLAIKQGAIPVTNDTTGTNLSQTVLAFSTKYLDSAAGSAAAKKLLGAWDQGAALVNADPDSFRQLLVDKARLPQPIATSYRVNKYPNAQLPAQADVDPVLVWMQGKKLLTKPLTYADIMWQGGGAAPSSSTPPTP